MTNKIEHRRYRKSICRMALPLMLASVLVLPVGFAGSAQAQTFSVLHTFTGGNIGGPGGSGPQADFLVRDGAGNLYGTTTYGGGGLGVCAIDIGCGVATRLRA